LPPLVFRFQQAHPGVEAELDFSSPRVELPDSPYDLVVRMGALADSSLVARSLHRVTARYVASPEFLARRGVIREPADLRELPLICGSVDQWLLVRAREQQLVQAKNGLRIVSGRAMRQAALAGMGVTRLADVYVQADIARGDLVEVLPASGQKPRRCHWCARRTVTSCRGYGS